MRSFLQDNFAPEAAADLETDIELRFPDNSVFCDVRGGVLSFPQIAEAELGCTLIRKIRLDACSAAKTTSWKLCARSNSLQRSLDLGF